MQIAQQVIFLLHFSKIFGIDSLQFLLHEITQNFMNKEKKEKNKYLYNLCVHSSLKNTAIMFFSYNFAIAISLSSIVWNYIKLNIWNIYNKKHHSFNLCVCGSLENAVIQLFFHNF